MQFIPKNQHLRDTLWYTNIAIENGQVDLPIQHGDFPIRFLCVYQRVIPIAGRFIIENPTKMG